MSQTSKPENLEKVRKAVKKLNSNYFTNKNITDETGLNYDQTKKYLQTMIDLDELKYSETTKIYMRI